MRARARWNKMERGREKKRDLFTANVINADSKKFQLVASLSTTSIASKV